MVAKVQFRKKIASAGTRRIITVPPALWEMLDFEREYLIILVPVHGGGADAGEATGKA